MVAIILIATTHGTIGFVVNTRREVPDGPLFLAFVPYLLIRALVGRIVRIWSAR